MFCCILLQLWPFLCTLHNCYWKEYIIHREWRSEKDFCIKHDARRIRWKLINRNTLDCMSQIIQVGIISETRSVSKRNFNQTTFFYSSYIHNNPQPAVQLSIKKIKYNNPKWSVLLACFGVLFCWPMMMLLLFWMWFSLLVYLYVHIRAVIGTKVLSALGMISRALFWSRHQVLYKMQVPHQTYIQTQFSFKNSIESNWIFVLLSMSEHEFHKTRRTTSNFWRILSI